MSDPDATDRPWPNWTEPTYIQVDGTRTAYRRAGSGTPILFLHGVGFTRQWLPIHQRLSTLGDLVAPDLPGFGATPLPSDFENFEDYVLHLDALISALNIHGAHIIGHGLGARIAAHLAVTYPQRFASLTLISPVGLRVDGENLVDVFRLSPNAARTAQFNGREATHTDTFELKGLPDDVLDGYGESAAHALLTWTNRFDRKLERRLSRVRIPTLVIAPEHDRYAGRGTAQRYADLMPDAQLRTISGPAQQPSSHALHIEQPDDVAHLVSQHLGAIATQED